MAETAFDWSDEAVAFLKVQWISGASAQAISDALNRRFRRNGHASRSAVLGKVMRSGLRRDMPRRSKERAEYRTRKVNPARASVPIASPVLQISNAKGLLDLRMNECRYAVAEEENVIGGHLFCAAETFGGQSYCPGHMSLSYRAEQR